MKKGSKVGGRAATCEMAGHTYEAGGSVLHSKNKYLHDALNEFGEYNFFFEIASSINKYFFMFDCQSTFSYNSFSLFSCGKMNNSKEVLVALF